MLTNEEILNNKQTYFKALAFLEEDTTDLMIYLESIGFFTAPASTQYYGAYAGGLCEYSLKTLHELEILSKEYYPIKYNEKDLIKVALLKDVYKAISYEVFNRNVKNETTGQWESVLSYRVKENRQVFGDPGFSSYMIVKNYVKLTDEQIEAIVYSGTTNTYAIDIHDVYRQYPLTLLTNMATMAVMHSLGEK